MITKEQAEELAVEFVERVCANVSGGAALAMEHTIEKPYGWMFFYDSNGYFRTGDWRMALVGNSPFVVESENGNITCLGTAGSLERNVAEFEWKRRYAGSVGVP